MPTGVLAWLAHLFTGVPYVLTAHLGDVPGGVPEQTDKLFKYAGWFARSVWKRAAAATAVSGFVQGLAVKAYRRPVEKILNGVRIDPEIENRNLKVENPRHLVFLGRFNPQKNLLFLIEALAKISDLDWRLTAIGDGPDMPRAGDRIAFHKLGKRVTLTGWIDSNAVGQVLQNADALLMPSLSEGMPVAAIEALKHGLAIIGSDIPGLYDVIENGVNGCLVPLGDPDVFASKLHWLLTNDETLLAMKNASWQKAREFDLKLIGAQYENVLKQAAKK
jgi:glycosyltransferase involved in cell wall biosynthesis